jgi:hypothetical protein
MFLRNVRAKNHEIGRAVEKLSNYAGMPALAAERAGHVRTFCSSSKPC